jgi:Uma2 family endonuclease
MQIVLNMPDSQAPFSVRPKHRMTSDEFWDFCEANADFRAELTSEGEIVIVPPTSIESGYRSGDVYAQLRNWARIDGRGRACDSSTMYALPNGALRSPDASWIAGSRLKLLTQDQKRRFAPICPDFVVEVMSPSDRLSRAQAKMDEWIENGTQLGWLIDPDRRAVYVYRPKQEVQLFVSAVQIIGVTPVDGFVLDLTPVWEDV